MRFRRAVIVTLTLSACSVEGIEYSAGLPVGSDASAPTVKDRPVPGPERDGSPKPSVVDAATEPDSGSVADTGAPKPVPCAEDRLLVGNENITPGDDDNVTVNEVNAFPYQVPAAGSAQCLRINFTAVNTSPVLVGVYSDSSASPRTRIAVGTIATPVVGWNKAVLDTPVTLTSGARLWLALTPKASEVRIPVKIDCNGRQRQSNVNGTLPATFASEGPDVYCDAAIFLSP